MKLLDSVIIGSMIGLGIGAFASLFLFIIPTEQQHGRAIQKLCDIVNQQHVYDTGHDIPLDCETLTTL